MHNIKELRKNFDDFKKLLKSRNVDINLDEIIKLDKENRDLIQEKENLEMEKKKFLNLRMSLCFLSLKRFQKKLMN